MTDTRTDRSPENRTRHLSLARQGTKAARQGLALGLWIVLLLTNPPGTSAQSTNVEDESVNVQDEADAAIRDAAMTYVHAIYDGDADRLARSVHPALSRRIVRRRSRGDTVQHTGAFALVEQAKQTEQVALPNDLRDVRLQVLDAYAGAASVRVSTSHWVEYLHLARIDGRWQVLNVLWETRARVP